MAKFSATLLCFAALVLAAAGATVPDLPEIMRMRSFSQFGRRRCLRQPRLICNVQPTAGNNIDGTILFEPFFMNRDTGCQVRVRARVTNLPGTAHGFHIHMYGDLSTDDGLSTGPHFANPQGIPVDHGFSSDAIRHWGDLDNLIANGSGVANYDRVDDVIEIPGIIGRGITIHIGEDQGSSVQPTGGSGARIGFCTIGFANPASTL